MRRDLTIKTGSLAGTSDFRVVASIKKGLVPALDAVTYKTRVKRVLRLLHNGRSGANEYDLARVLSDAVERVGRIHSVAIAVLEPEDKVLLTVTFDGAWESYVRVIWQKVSRLLDLIFCNTEDYVLGYENSYDAWGAWLKRSQTEATFLYATPGLTVDDERYLRMQERVHRRKAGTDAEQIVTRIRIPSVEEIADQSIFRNDDGYFGVDPTNAGFSSPVSVESAGRPPFRQGVRSLVGLYRLADVYPRHTTDGEILLRAAHELLPEFVKMLGAGNSYEDGISRARKRYEEAMDWLQADPPPEPDIRKVVEPPEAPPLRDRGNVQGGIVHSYPADASHGCLLLLQFASPAAMAALLQALPVTTEASTPQIGEIATNIAFTVEGLRVAGLTDNEVRSLPDEFVQGMERRAGLLGDVRINHPRRWRLPGLNWSDGANAPDLAEDDASPRIDMSAVHAIVQVRLRVAQKAETANPRDLLMAAMERFVAVDAGVTPLSLQWMQRHQNREGRFEEPFGFLDANSDPILYKTKAGDEFKNHVHLGEVLHGYPNLADNTITRPTTQNACSTLLDDGSFLVIRKLRQDVPALEEALQAGVKRSAEQAAPGSSAPALSREEILAKMMGRWPSGHPDAGRPLVHEPPADPESNDFHFNFDETGEVCPFHAHIRRANPRTTAPEKNSRPARLFRRGMSYGPPIRRARLDNDTLQDASAERGLVFMAYNASLGEQFEVVQRWLSGGNSSGSFSGQSDPFLGLAEPGRKRHFRFARGDETARVALDGSDSLHEDPRPFVRLEWGLYLFAPSIEAIGVLKARAAAQDHRPSVTWCIEAGEQKIRDLQALEASLGEEQAIIAWKSALEDPDAAADFTTASIWAAIRERHGGALRTSFGVLVADREMVEDVMKDAGRNLTITAYLPRMRRSFGILYLGLDPLQPDGAYESESKACNDAIMALDQHEIFEQARSKTLNALAALVDEAKGYAKTDGETRWELTLDARELVDPLLACFCEEWFGLENGDFFKRSGYRWDWSPATPPLYPGHFLSPSRYIFQPHPGPDVETIGAAHGSAVQRAMVAFLKSHGAKITAPVTRAVLDNPPGDTNVAFAARTIAGAMMGFIPTVEGNVRRILNEWLREGTLWTLRARFGTTKAADFTDACNRLGSAFVPAFQSRAVPELIWRTAVTSHSIGKNKPVSIRPGDIVVASAISATQQNLQEGNPDFYPAFGGNRRASGHPTHACPGANPALAAMLGFFSALVETQEPLRAGPAPLTFSLDGILPGQSQPDSATIMAKSRSRFPDDRLHMKHRSPGWLTDAHMFEIKAADAVKKSAMTPFATIGDSWLFDFPFNFRPSLTSALYKAGYQAVPYYHWGMYGDRLEDLVKDASLQSIRTKLSTFHPQKPKPKAILIGGGGNDVVYHYETPELTPLFALLHQAPAPGTDPLKLDEVKSFIDEKLGGFYEKLIQCLLDALHDKPDIPILIHAYDHPIPDGTPDPSGNGPWLQPVFTKCDIHDFNVARSVMQRLIDRLNDVVARCAAAHPGRVYHVKLTGILAGKFEPPDNYKHLWANELHPNKTGYDYHAEEIVKQLQTLNIGGLVPAG